MAVELVSVITPTHKRQAELLRAVRSVAKQDYRPIEHIIVGDRHPQLENLIGQIKKINHQAKVVNLDIPVNIHYASIRAAKVRNHGIDIAKGEYIAFLDDDNEIEPNHIRSLVEVLKASGAQAARSWCKLFARDGKPFIPTTSPWITDPEEADKVYKKQLEEGIFIPGSNELRDPLFASMGEREFGVDTGEWLISKRVLDKIRFPTVFTPQQIKLGITEDVLFAKNIAQAGIFVVASEKATLKYYLGGYSTNKEG